MTSRLVILLATLAVAAGAALPASAAARTDGAAKPVVFLSGGESGAAVDCEIAWGKLQQRLRRMTFTIARRSHKFTGAFETVSSYDTDRHCGHVLSGGGAQSLDGQARAFAKWLRDRHSASGEAVDVVAHGTGGLVVRYALAMAASGAPNWPAPLLVEDVVTLGTPHGLSKAIADACSRPVCKELDPASDAGKALAAKLAAPAWANPQAPGGTDWTVIAAAGDTLAPPDSALAMDAAHKATYLDAAMTHPKLLTDASDARDAKIVYQHAGRDPVEWRRAPHVADRVGLNLVYGADGGLDPGANRPGCAGFNDQAGGPTAVRNPGLASWKGGTEDLSFVRFGPVEAYADCFKKSADKTYASTGVVRVNGLDFTPAAGEQIVLDPVNRRLRSKKATLTIPSKWFGAVPVPLMSDEEFDWLLPKAAGALEGNEADGLGLSGAGKVAGFSIKGSGRLTLDQGSIVLDTSLALPGVFSGNLPPGPDGLPRAQCSNGLDDDKDGKYDLADGECKTKDDNYENAADGPGIAVKITSTNLTGLQIDKISGTAEGGITLRGLKLGAGVTFSYSLAANEWSAEATVTVPIPQAPTIKAGVGMANGSLKSLSAEVLNMGAGPLFAGMYLQRIKLGLVLDPVEVTFGTGFSWGARVPTSDGPVALQEIEGDLTVSAAALKLSGKYLLLGDEWGTGSAEYKFGTGLTLTAELGRSVDLNKNSERAKFKATFKGRFNGAIDAAGVDMTAGVQACFAGELKFWVVEQSVESTCLTDSTIRASVKAGQNGKPGQMGLSACGKIDLGVWAGEAGLGAKAYVTAFGHPAWTGELMAGACDMDKWHTVAGASQAQDAGVTVAGRPDAVAFAIRGTEAPPRVALDGPGAAAVAAPAAAAGIVRGNRSLIIHSDADKTTYVFLGRPAEGRWTVVAQPGSSPVAEVRSADALPAPAVSARLSRARGGLRTLRYAVKPLRGQVVRFVERGAGVSRPLGTARGSRGVLRFRPGFGPAGKRRVVAEVEQYGLPRREIAVARFRAAKPALPRAPRRVQLRRRGERLTVTWAAVPGAAGYVVGVETGDGRDIRFDVARGKARRVVVRRMLGGRASRVSVRALRPDGAMGRAKTVRGGR